jgi:hypothetical protein
MMMMMTHLEVLRKSPSSATVDCVAFSCSKYPSSVIEDIRDCNLHILTSRMYNFDT